MALTFGPEHLGVSPRTVDDVSVVALPSRTPAVLVDGIHVDNLGNISFTVVDPNRYEIEVYDGSVSVTKTVFLSDILRYDITDPRSFAQFAPTVGEGSTSGGGGGVTDHGQLTGLGDDDHPQYLTNARGTALFQPLGDYAPSTHTHTSSQISDATSVGKSILTAADATAVRTAIGAGTSSVVIGTTSTTAKAGDYQPAAANISDSTSVGRSLITAADEATARTAIGAGTSNLAIGTTSTTAKAGNYQPTAANISDASTTGRSVLTGADASAIRTTLGAAATSHTHTASQISDSTATGRSVVTATDATAARTALGAAGSTETTTALSAKLTVATDSPIKPTDVWMCTAAEVPVTPVTGRLYFVFEEA